MDVGNFVEALGWGGGRGCPHQGLALRPDEHYVLAVLRDLIS